MVHAEDDDLEGFGVAVKSNSNVKNKSFKVTNMQSKDVVTDLLRNHYPHYFQAARAIAIQWTPYTINVCTLTKLA